MAAVGVRPKPSLSQSIAAVALQCSGSACSASAAGDDTHPLSAAVAAARAQRDSLPVQLPAESSE
jgi:hypothetical protein